MGGKSTIFIQKQEAAAMTYLIFSRYTGTTTGEKAIPTLGIVNALLLNY